MVEAAVACHDLGSHLHRKMDNGILQVSSIEIGRSFLKRVMVDSEIKASTYVDRCRRQADDWPMEKERLELHAHPSSR